MALDADRLRDAIIDLLAAKVPGIGAAELEQVRTGLVEAIAEATVVEMDDNFSGGGGGGTPDPHAPSHKSGGSDELLLNEFGDPDGPVEFAQHQSLQFVIENRTSDPASPVPGQIWYRTDL